MQRLRLRLLHSHSEDPTTKAEDMTINGMGHLATWSLNDKPPLLVTIQTPPTPVRILTMLTPRLNCFLPYLGQ